MGALTVTMSPSISGRNLFGFRPVTLEFKGYEMCTAGVDQHVLCSLGSSTALGRSDYTLCLATHGFLIINETAMKRSRNPGFARLRLQQSKFRPYIGGRPYTAGAPWSKYWGPDPLGPHKVGAYECRHGLSARAER